MKISALLLFIGLLQVSAMTKAQQITLHLKDASFETAIAQVHQQSGYAFLYNTDYLKNARPVTVDLKQATIGQALAAIFRGQPFTYQVSAKSIVVTPIPPAVPDKMQTPAGHPVHGTVTDSTGSALSGVTVRIKGTNRIAVTDASGNYSVDDIDAGDVLVFSMIGYQAQEIEVGAKGEINMVLHAETAALHQVNVVSTGYQTLPEERATGSFDVISNKLINRSVSPNILDHLNGIASGISFNNDGAGANGVYPAPVQTGNINHNSLGITVRGTSTLNPSLVGADPLIVVDNFPYEGDIRNINPNDVASITILKDAAAASIWGARAGNGVIVITTKKGALNEPLKISFNSSVTVVNKPNVFYDKNYLDASDFIDAETYLFNQGYFNSDLNNKTTRPVVSPVVELLAAEKAGTVSSSEAQSQINALRNNDVRDDIEQYMYQKAVRQQYSLGLLGGTPQLAYALSIGYDDNSESLVRNGEQRITINSTNTYHPVKHLDLTGAINYSQSNVQSNNVLPWGAITSGGKYGLMPYAQLADNNGNPLAIVKDNRMTYVDSIQRQGFLDQHYRPLSEINMADNTAKISDLLLKASAVYHITHQFNVQLLYQNEHQVTTTDNNQIQGTYYTNSLINKFTQYNSATGTFTYPFPPGDILGLGNYTLNSNNLRGQLNYTNLIAGKHAITALAGAEMNQNTTDGYSRTSYGYDDQFGTAVNNLNYATTYPTNPSGAATITSPDASVTGVTYRFLSYFANAGYTYDNKYTITLSGRKDGANIFGAKTNDRITPLWSAGIGWNVSNEKFYHSDWFPYLKLRGSYGFNGNVYNGSAYSTGIYLPSTITNAPYINGLTPPNSDLTWEKVKNINLGIDFETANNILKGTVELYQKDGQDLIESEPLPPSTGFTSFNGNAASTRTNGIDVTLVSQNINAAFKWSTTLLFSYLHDKVISYDMTQTTSTIQSLQGIPMPGKPIYSIFSYRWAGLDPTNGDPEGYLNGQVSKDYTGIINNFKPDSLVFNGSARPTIFGSLRNDFSYHGFNLSLNITYKLGYYFRRPSVNLNYQNVLTTPNADYSLRWQKPGDEKITSVPSLVYPSNNNRNTFYQYSSVLVQRGDNIRLQDIRLGYDITRQLWHKMPFKTLEVYSYASNLGILWRANKYGIDPDALSPVLGGHRLQVPFSISFGIQATY